MSWRTEQLYLLQIAAERLPEAIVVVDSVGRLLHANEVGRRLWRLNELTAGQRVGEGVVAERPDGGVVQPSEVLFGRALDRGESVRDLDLTLLSPEGTPLHTVSSADPILDDAGQLVGVIVVTTIQSERTPSEAREEALEAKLATASAVASFAEASERASREELRIVRESLTEALRHLEESETRLRAVGQSFLFGIWLANSKGEMIYTSESFLDLLGKTAEEVGSLGWMAGLEGEDRESALAQWRNCVHTSTLWERESLVRAKDGAKHTILSRGAPLQDEEGKAVLWTGINVDLTEREKVHLSINNARIYAEGIIATVREPLVVLTEDLRVRSASASFYRDFAVSQEEIVGRYLYDLGDGQWNIPSLQGLLRDVLDQNQSFDGFVVERDFPRLGHKVMLLNARPIVQEGNNVRLILLAIEDVTARTEVERLREEYVGLISHDLRNPLAGILGNLELLRRLLTKKGLSGEASSAESALRSARRMNLMIQDLVETTRLETGHIELHREPISLYSLVTEIVERIGLPEERERIEIVPDYPAAVVSADAGRLERAITNLITNALKYSNPQEPVTVRIWQGEDGRGVVSVTDRGVGIHPEDLNQIFRRFFRARTAKRADGLGLGLYITSLIAEAHGGTVWAESDLGKGSRFHLALPLA